MISRAASAAALSFLVVTAANGNWFRDKVAANLDLKKDIGTGISVVAQPTIDSAQTAAQSLLDEADRRVGARLGQVDPLVDKQLGKVDVLLENRIGQIDGIAATRLRDVDAIADKSIKRIDTIAAQRIAQIDDLLKARVSDVDSLLRTNISDVDERIGARIQQIDDLTERRFGNVETLAAKSTAALGAAVLRLIAFGCLVIFAAAAVWRVYVESTGAWPNDGSLFSRIAAWWRKVHGRLGWQLGAAAACIVVLFVIFIQFIPSGGSEQLEQSHRRQMERSLAALDLTEAKYHVSQLRILDPTNTLYRSVALKIDLVRDILSRPALYQTAAGLHQTLWRIEQAESQLEWRHDPDLETLQALILFRTNPSRQSEHDAAMLCATALERSGDDDDGFALRPLAVNFVKNYLAHPLAGAEAAPKEYTPATLASLAVKAPPASPLSPLSAVLTYDGLVRDLMSASEPAYRKLLDAQAELAKAPAAQRAALIEKRKGAARAVITAWENFDDALASHHSIDETSAAYAVFTLNDAMVSRARAYEASSKPDVPPPLSEANYPDAAARARMLPPRVMWAKRYLGNAGASVQTLIAMEEANRFRRYESQAYELEKSYAAKPAAFATALAAARLGLDPSTASLTPEERKTVEAAMREAPVTFL
jgi:hypothetical protein